MKKQIIITVILLIATIAVTVYYFANLNPPGFQNNQVVQAIPENAPFIIEFNNEKSFYDVFKDNNLFSVLAGKQTLAEAVSLIKQNTRRFAKRQLTWFRKDEQIVWLNAEQPMIDFENWLSNKEIKIV